MSIDQKNIPDLDHLFQDLSHPNPNINRKAFQAMHSFWPNESKDRLMGNLNCQDIDLRRKSVNALSFFGKDVIKPIVDLYLSTEEKVLHLSCLKVLVKVAANNELDNYFEDINSVIELAINDYSVEISLTLINLLRQIGEPGILPLIQIAKEKDLLRSRAAITALGEISDPQVAQFLKDLAKGLDIDPIIREAITISLEKK